MTFNLVLDPWVPIRYPDGTETELSLAGVFADSPSIGEIAIPFALEYAATLRLMVVVLQSALGGPSSAREKGRWLDSHDALRPQVAEYLERWRPRFELFDPELPFMQRPIGDILEPAPIAALRPDWASGNNATLFDHRWDARPTPLDAGAAARALLTTLLFQPGGGRGPKSTPYRTDSPGTHALHVFVDADSLWDTLCLNAVTLDADDSSRPVWEIDPDQREPANEGTHSAGWLDRATWRARAIELIAQPDGRVATCRIHQHLKLADDGLFDPYAPVRRREGEEPTIMRASSAKAIWRDAEALLRALRPAGMPARVAEEAVGIYDRRALERGEDSVVPALRVIGQIVNQAKVADVADARLPVSRALLSDEARLAAVGALLVAADIGAAAVRVAIHAMATARGAADGWGLAGRRETNYWAATSAPFHAGLREIATSATAETLFEEVVVPWRNDVCRRARAAYDAAVREASADPRADQALAHGRVALERRLATVHPDKESSA